MAAAWARVTAVSSSISRRCKGSGSIRRRARCASPAAAVWGDVDHATHPFGLAVPSGFISTTGVGGLTLGGGIGYLTRALRPDDRQPAVGRRRAGRRQRRDGRRAQPHRSVLGAARRRRQLRRRDVVRIPGCTRSGPCMPDRRSGRWNRAAEVMAAYRDFILRAPEYVNGFFAFLTVPPAPMFPEHLHLKKVCGVMWACHRSRRRVRTRPPRARCVRSGKPLLDHQAEMPLPAVNSLFDALYPPGLQWYWRADFVKELSDEAIARHAQHGAALPTMHSTMHLYAIDGAAHRVGRDDTAFSYRDANWAEVIVGVDPDPGQRRHDHDVVQGILRRPPPVFGRRRLHQLHDGRGSGPRASVVPGELRSAGI